MGDYSFGLSCLCGCTGASLAADSADLGEWQRQIALGNIGPFQCGLCQCQHTIVDLGTDISCVSNSMPAILAVDVNSGSIAGGDTVTLFGHVFNVGTLSVTFGGVPAIVEGSIRTFRDATLLGAPTKFQATVITPAYPNPSYVDIVVQNENGLRVPNPALGYNWSGTLSRGFMYS